MILLTLIIRDIISSGIPGQSCYTPGYGEMSLPAAIDTMRYMLSPLTSAGGTALRIISYFAIDRDLRYRRYYYCHIFDAGLLISLFSFIFSTLIARAAPRNAARYHSFAYAAACLASSLAGHAKMATSFLFILLPAHLLVA